MFQQIPMNSDSNWNGHSGGGKRRRSGEHKGVPYICQFLIVNPRLHNEIAYRTNKTDVRPNARCTQDYEARVAVNDLHAYPVPFTLRRRVVWRDSRYLNAVFPLH